MQGVGLEEDGVAAAKVGGAPDLVLREEDAAINDSLPCVVAETAEMGAREDGEGTQLERAVAEGDPNGPEIAQHADVVRVLMRLCRHVGMGGEDAAGIGRAQAEVARAACDGLKRAMDGHAIAEGPHLGAALHVPGG